MSESMPQPKKKPIASLSLDLDNKWSYLKTHGDAGWEAYPSYLDILCPRVVELLAERGLRITFFVVGQDAALPENRDALRLLANSGHEIGNHSFHHEPWLHRYTPDQVTEELQRAHDQIADVTGYEPVGFRGPGFSVTPTVIAALERMQYRYDCSTFPTFLGPLARAYYFMSADLDAEQRAQRRQLFGKFREGFGKLRPYRFRDGASPLVEIPVTTMPVFKVPIHLSYLMYLGQISQTLAIAWFRTAMAMCRLHRIQPSLLLHPLDFLGADDDQDLAFFPAMGLERDRKLALAAAVLNVFQSQFDVVPMLEHAAHADATLPRSSRPRTDDFCCVSPIDNSSEGAPVPRVTPSPNEQPEQLHGRSERSAWMTETSGNRGR